MKNFSGFDFDDDVHIDLTPLIDVIFMLVIFFILTMSFAQPIIDIVLPKSAVSEVKKEGQTLDVVINKEGVILCRDQVVEREELHALLRAEPERPLNIKADREAPFQSFIEVVDAAKAERGGKFAITTLSD